MTLRPAHSTLTAALLALPALVALCLPTPAAASPPETSTPDLRDVGAVVDQVLPDQLADGDIPGAVVTVVAGGETVFSSGYGVADPATGAPMDPATTGLYTASEGKLFTATAVMQLVEEGTLDLRADVNEYLDTPIPDTYPGRPVTLEHLLTFTSGFDYDIYGWSQWEYSELPTLAEFATEVRPDRVRPPGELVAYNNFDYVLAGRIVEIASGQSYADYLAEHVFAPAGMSSTTAQQPHPAELQARTSPGYRPADGRQEPAGGQVSPATPAGTDTLTTAADMGRFMIAQLRADSPLGTEATGEMQAEQFRADPEVPGMGYAFEQRPMNGQQVITKDGDQPGTHHNLALLPEHDIGIHVAYNGDGSNGAAFWGGKELVRAILDAYFPTDGQDTADAASAGADVEPLAGSYRAARTSQGTFTTVTSLTGPVTVEATRPGHDQHHRTVREPRRRRPGLAPDLTRALRPRRRSGHAGGDRVRGAGHQPDAEQLLRATAVVRGADAAPDPARAHRAGPAGRVRHHSGASSRLPGARARAWAARGQDGPGPDLAERAVSGDLRGRVRPGLRRSEPARPDPADRLAGALARAEHDDRDGRGDRGHDRAHRGGLGPAVVERDRPDRADRDHPGGHRLRHRRDLLPADRSAVHAHRMTAGALARNTTRLPIPPRPTGGPDDRPTRPAGRRRALYPPQYVHRSG
ncbi:serine hydrolase domain-containing protein [Ruania zhangjianzhongii]|uniref:serine hydrolase domain-containing protein n=1 Tax=Ruania zhangjianzhongii TaxID=2603206 RepID=UPI0011C884A5|nr:serine hydrolase domain-containing protein [Ruania zhangjianzhongii]